MNKKIIESLFDEDDILFCRHRQLPSNNFYLHDLLKRIYVFINRRQMKLQNHQKRLDDLQQDLLLSESERSKNRAALERKDFEVRSFKTNVELFDRLIENLFQGASIAPTAVQSRTNDTGYDEQIR